MSPEDHLARLLDEAEARQLPALIAEWTGSGALGWLARALRLDLALLTERPALVRTCLVARCAWLGAEGEASFYAHRPPLPGDVAELRAMMAAWHARWPPRAWLRALRPPRIPLDEAVVEEYRTSLRGQLAVAPAKIGVLGDDGTAIAWDRETGRRTSVAALAPTDDPRITRDGDVIRVWSHAGRAFVERDATTFIDAAFSPNGERLVTGDLLCDGRSGRPIAALAMTGTRWEVGGPPEHCQRLTDAMLVETSPHGTRAWSALDGSRLADDRARRAGHEHVVAFDAQGRHHAIARRELAVYDVLSGVQLFAQDTGRQVERLGFSADGMHLTWMLVDGAYHELELATQIVRPIAVGAARWEATPEEIEVRDGVLTIGDASTPCDGARVVVSPARDRVADRHGHWEVVGASDTVP